MTDLDWYMKVWHNTILRPDRNVEANPDVTRSVIAMLTLAAQFDPIPPHRTLADYLEGQGPEFVGDVIDLLVAMFVGASVPDFAAILRGAAIDFEIRHAREYGEKAGNE